MDVMTFYVTRIKRKSKGSLSSKSRPHFVSYGKRKRLPPVVGSGVLTGENTLPETAQNFFFVFFILLATFCVTERESVAMLARFDVKGDTKATHLFYQNFKFVLLFFSKNAQCTANKFAHLKLILRYLKLLLW